MTRTPILIGLALALALPGLAQDGKPEDRFRRALSSQNGKALEEACRELVAIGTPPMAKVILSSLSAPRLDTDIYWILVRACAAFATTDGLEEVAEYVVRHKGQPASRDLAMALHNNFNVQVEGAMIRILRDGNEELRLLALDHLADVGRKDAVTAIVEILRKEGERPASTEVRRRMFLALAGITGQDFGESVSNWTGWWDVNSGKSWEELKKPPSGGGSDFGYTRAMDLEKVRQQKVLLVHSGNACRCKNNHDLDRNVAGAVGGMGITLDQVTKDQFEKDGGTLSSGETFKPSDYIAIIVMCTQIYEHCVCPKCKRGDAGQNRMFQ